MRLAVVYLGAAAALILHHAPPATDLNFPPTSEVELSWLSQTYEELSDWDDGELQAAAIDKSIENLRGNWTLSNFHGDEPYIAGMRVRVVGKQIFFQPEPPELRALATSDDPASRQQFDMFFRVPAAHALVQLRKTARAFPLPNVDFVMGFGDICFGKTRAKHEVWGLAPENAADRARAAAEPNTADEGRLPPVFHWSNTRSGRKTCNAITTTGYDWVWWSQNFSEGSAWRIDATPAPAWAEREPTLFWRGSSISWDGIRARAARLSLAHPSLVDVKFQEGALDCDKYVTDTAGFDGNNTVADCFKVTSPFIPMSAWTKNKYALEMDGGSTTWRFKNILLGGFLVFKVDSDEEQFFSRSLQPFVHYVPVDKADFEADLLRKLAWAKSHDAEASRIAARAQTFAREHLTPREAEWQQQAALSVWHRKQASEAREALPSQLRFCCADLKNLTSGKSAPALATVPPQDLVGLLAECVEEDDACAAAERTSLVKRDWRGALPHGSFLAQIPPAQQQYWQELANVLAPFVLSEGFATQSPAQMQEYNIMSSQAHVKTICETGFNAGHSALLFLLSNPEAKMISFDLGQYGYTLAASQWMAKKFPKRFEFVAGDSTLTVPQYAASHPATKCDLLSVDGGHSLEVAAADIINFGKMASPSNVVIVDDTPCTMHFCIGPLGAWNAALQNGLIQQIRLVPLDPARGFSIGTYVQGTTPMPGAAVPPTTPAPVVLSASKRQPFTSAPPAPLLATAAPVSTTPTPPAPYTGPQFKQGVDVIDYLVQHTKTVKWDKFAVNLGAGDGVAMIPGVSCAAGFDCANQYSDPVYPLFAMRGYRGLCVEGNPQYLPLLNQNLPNPKISKVQAMINPANVVGLIQKANAPKGMDYFKNDIDGYDCAVHLAVMDAGYRPKVIEVEVNPDVPAPITFGVLYSPTYKPNLGAAGFYGCSISLTSAIFRPFGYVLAEVGMGHDAVYVRSDIAKEAGIKGMTDEQASTKLGSCCLTGHWGTLGGFSYWSAMPVPQREVAVQQAALQGCVLSQGTPVCGVPFTTKADDFLKLARQAAR